MKRNFNFLYTIIFCLIGSCLITTDRKLEIRDFYVEGVADSNHLEKGLWKFYDLEKQNLIQEGDFSNGVRIGMWNYYFPISDSIFWSLCYNKDSLIKTNIPSFLFVDFEEENFIAFRHKDSAKLLLLKIAVGNGSNFNSDMYNNIMRKEIIDNSLKVNTSNYSQIQTTCGRFFNFNKFSGIDKENRSYKLLTINSILKNLLIEVTVRCNSEYYDFGEEVFFSVMSNLFIGGNRFFDGNIDCEIIHNKLVRNKRTFSFGCNSK
jgi:hypothetical protein